jgi:chromosome segregation ATPase
LQSIETKDKEIVSLKNTEKEKQQIIGDLTLKLLQMKENINALNKRCKRVDEKNSNLQQSVQNPKWILCREVRMGLNVSTTTQHH